MCKDAVNRDSTCQSIFRRLCIAKKIEDFRFLVSRPNDVSSRPDDAGLSSVRTGRHVVRTDGTVDRWASRRDGSIVQTADRELEFLLTCRL